MQIRSFKTFCLLGFVFLFAVTGSCQNTETLKRSAFLGARLMDLSIVEEETGTETGIYLSEILPSGSLGKMEVPAGGVLQQINESPIRSLRDLGGALSGIKEGDNLKVLVFENGKQISYQEPAVGRPIEQHPNATVDFGQVSYQDNVLRSMLYLPNGVEQPPVVYFIQGYTCQSIEMRNDNPAKQLIDQWIKEGYAVFLVEKPGMGDSQSKIPCMDIDFDQELVAFTKAYEALQQNPKVDTKNIFLFGHSMGGIIAPLLEKTRTPAGIMVYGIVGKSWYDYMQDIYTEQPLLFGTGEEEIKDNKTYYLPFIKDMLVNKKSNTELLESPIYSARLKEDGVAESLADGYFIQRHYRYWQTLADVDVPGAWSGVHSPVLVLHGEYDIQAIHPKYGEMIVTNVNEHNGDASFQLFPKTEHAFLQFDSREDLQTVMNNGTYARAFATHFNPEIAVKTLAWMKEQSK